jgi:hypothetical protein
MLGGDNAIPREHHVCRQKIDILAVALEHTENRVGILRFQHAVVQTAQYLQM